MAGAAPAGRARLLDARSAAMVHASRRPLLVAGGGVIYSGATDALGRLAAATGLPVAETQAGKGALRYDHPASLGSLGATGTTAANQVAPRRRPRHRPWHTLERLYNRVPRSAFQDPGVSFVNINVTPFDTTKLACDGCGCRCP